MNITKSSEFSSATVIGWREIVTLPKLNISYLKAKIDTGAKSSALDADDIEEFTKDGKTMVRFQIHTLQKNNREVVSAEAELLEYRSVKSSNGQKQTRPVILTPVTLGSQQWQIELTLTNRASMKFRMLLGRKAMCDRFLVDPGKSFLQSNPDLPSK